MRLLQPPARMSAERMELQGRDLFDAPRSGVRSCEEKRMSMIFQDPKYSLNPMMTVGSQIIEAYQAHLRAAVHRPIAPAVRHSCIGQNTRPGSGHAPLSTSGFGRNGPAVMIAMMLVSAPDLLIADEPTSALDVTVQRSLLTFWTN